jgi:hypothetical protein
MQARAIDDEKIAGRFGSGQYISIWIDRFTCITARSLRWIMKRNILKSTSFALAGFLFITCFSASVAAQARTARNTAPAKAETTAPPAQIPGMWNFHWGTVANNATIIPGTGGIKFSSYGQPSVNTKGNVVFRGRSTMGGNRASGIYYRNSLYQPLKVMADNRMEVPYPNNLNTEFTEFSAFPRIAMNTDLMTIRGMHSPVYKYILPDGEETRVGNTGVYLKFGDGLLVTAASKLGAAPDFEYFSVPDQKALAFDVFPGPQSVTDDGYIVFKGNFTINDEEQTGVFFRRVLETPGGGIGYLTMIASSLMDMPDVLFPVKFDSTSPPTAVGNRVLFLGLDNEDDPTYGGIYMADLVHQPVLTKIASIGETFAGTPEPLSRLGETIAFDGRYIAFWGAWGRDMAYVKMYCPEDGNREILAYCNGQDPKSIYDKEAGRWFQINLVPVNQGIFVYDLQTGMSYMAADNKGYLKDFLFWVYSGHIPAEEEEDAEPPRWRGAAFVTISDGWVAFKGRATDLTGDKTYVDPIDGIYMTNPVIGDGLKIVVETGMDGAYLDTSIPVHFRATLPITNVGIERDGFRGNMLAITATMDDGENNWGGVYLTNFDFETTTKLSGNTSLKR